MLAAIVSSSEDAIVSKDLNGIVTSWNKAAERIYGWKADEIIGRSKGLVIPPDLPNELPNILARISAGKRIEHYETSRIRKDGRRIEVAISVSPVHNSDGQVIGAATIVRDITESKRIQKELQRRQAEVEALNQRLTRAMQETHHRVKNNLQIISGVIDMQIIEHRLTRTLPIEELERLSKQIRTLALVHDLLTKKIGQNENEQMLSSSAVLERLVALLQETSGTRSIHSQIEDIALTAKQMVALSLIVNELVSNAIKHSGGAVRVSFGPIECNAELTVCDEGPGFPEQFDAVSQAHTGLELVMSLAETDLKGKATFKNKEEGGAKVVVLFPSPMEMGTDKPVASIKDSTLQ